MFVLNGATNFIKCRLPPASLFWAALAWGQSPPLGGIAHVAFRVSDVTAAREFYQKLGFEQAFALEQGGETREAFLKVNDRQFIELYPPTADSQLLGLMDARYETADIEAVNADYVKGGLKPSAARNFSAGNLLFTLRDPEDVIIEYTQYMPGSRHTGDGGQHLREHRASDELLGAMFPVKDLAVVRAFYFGKLGFQDLDGRQTIRLRIPDGSAHFVELEPGGDKGKAGLWFRVADVFAWTVGPPIDKTISSRR